MLKIKEYMSYDGLGLGNLVKTGQVSASELLETAIQRCEQVNPKLNAVTISLYEQARSYIKTHTHCNQSSPFTGVPFLCLRISTDFASYVLLLKISCPKLLQLLFTGCLIICY